MEKDADGAMQCAVMFRACASQDKGGLISLESKSYRIKCSRSVDFYSTYNTREGGRELCSTQ